MIPFFKAAIFLLFNGLFHDATNHHITKEDEEERRRGPLRRGSLVVRRPSLLVVLSSASAAGSVGVLHLIYGGVLMCSCHFQTE